MDNSLTRRQFFEQAILGAAVLGTACVKIDMPYLLGNPAALDTLVEECRVPAEAGKANSYPLSMSSQNWFYREAHVEIYNPSGKLLAKGNFSAFQGDSIPFTLRLEKVLLDPGAKIKITRVDGNETSFTFPDYLGKKRGDIRYFGDENPDDITPWDSARKVDSAQVVLRIQQNTLIPVMSATLNYAPRPESQDGCRYVEKATFFCINDALQKEKRRK